MEQVRTEPTIDETEVPRAFRPQVLDRPPRRAPAPPAPASAAPAATKRSGPVSVRVIDAPERTASRAGPPWFFAFPGMAIEAVKIAFMPLKWFVTACEVVVSVTFAALVAIVLMWWFRIIPDADVFAFVASFGERIQGILKGSGLM